MKARDASIVLDASALLAYLRNEPGRSTVDAALTVFPVISAVNYAEVLSRLAEVGADPDKVHRQLVDDGLLGEIIQILPFGGSAAVAAARLRTATRQFGLSAGDRACLATALRLGAPVLTADRIWAQVAVGVEIQLIR